MKIQHKDDGPEGAFFIRQNNELLAEMTYVWAGNDRIIIDHTRVNPSLKGKGIGRQMVAMAVDFAREKQIKIVPLCPFARSVFDKEKTFTDVL